MRGLRTEWDSVPLRTLGRWTGGGTPSKSDPTFWVSVGIPWVSPKDMKRFLVLDTEDHITKEAIDSSATTLVPAGSVLVVARSGILEHTLPVAKAGVAIALNQDMKALVPRKQVDGDYVLYLLRAFSQEILRTCSKRGTTVANLDFNRFLNFEVPLAPNFEQRRIVTKLDSLLARSKNARNELSRIPKLVEGYKQAVLKAAYDEAETAATQLTTLGAVADEVRNGVSRKPENAPPGIPVLKISAVRPMIVRMDQRRYYVPEAGEDVSRYALRAGDLLFTRYNGNPDLVANCGMVRDPHGELIYPDKLIRIRVDRQLADPEFVEALGASPQARNALAPFIKSAAGQHGISGADLKRLPIPLPPKDRQEKIITLIRRSFAAIDLITSESSRALSLLDRFDQATLGKAFRGELVPHDPADERALELVHRIIQ